MFFEDFPFLDVVSFVKLCQNMFFPTEEITLANFLTLHAGLYYLFSYVQQDPTTYGILDRTALEAVIELCSSNVEVVAQNLRLQMTASLEIVQSLILTVCRLFADLSWMLTDQGVRLDRHWQRERRLRGCHARMQTMLSCRPTSAQQTRCREHTYQEADILERIYH